MINSRMILALPADHSPFLMLILKNNSDKNAHGLWKLNISLVFDTMHIAIIKRFIRKTTIEYSNTTI